MLFDSLLYRIEIEMDRSFLPNNDQMISYHYICSIQLNVRTVIRLISIESIIEHLSNGVSFFESVYIYRDVFEIVKGYFNERAPLKINLYFLKLI